jgi:hypothetical protein
MCHFMLNWKLYDEFDRQNNRVDAALNSKDVNYIVTGVFTEKGFGSKGETYLVFMVFKFHLFDRFNCKDKNVYW